ncbi:MAG: radical SAM/SPASM domain-containing protein [Thermodesulfobacteriota bacterium]
MCGLEAPRWQYLQVEVTTRCNLAGCAMCPRTAWPERWQARDLAWETWEALMPSLKFFSQVHLGGWGEPLLHPRLWDLVQGLRSQRVEVSLTTNGVGLREEARTQILEHLNLVTISLDGAQAKTYGRLRPGGDFYRIIGNIAALCSRKQSLGLARPKVVLRFLKMRPNLAELPEFLRLAASLGVDRVDAPNLAFIPVPAMEPLSLLSPGPPDSRIKAIQQEAEREAWALKLPFRNFSLSPNFNLRVCEANPLGQAFVTVSGEVAPCAYLGLPVNGSFTRRYFNKSYQTGNYSYGNAREHGLLKLYQQPAYLNFIDYFRSPAEIFALLQPVRDADRPAAEPSGASPVATALGRWPPPCQGCLKSLGV